MHIQTFIKICPFVLKILRKNTFLNQSRAITLLFIYEFSPFAIQNHSSLISMSMQSLKKINQKLLQLESGNEALKGEQMHRQTEGWTLKQFGWYNIMPHHTFLFSVAGYKKCWLLTTWSFEIFVFARAHYFKQYGHATLNIDVRIQTLINHSPVVFCTCLH